MTKRRIERDLDALEEDLEDDLKPEDWLQVALRGFAEEREEWREQLYELCPRQTYTQGDERYVGRLRLAGMLARRAVYDLHTTALEVELVLLRNTCSVVLTWSSDLDPSDIGVSDTDESAIQPSTLLGDLYIHYISYERFANEVLGVGLDTWAGVYPEGRPVVQSAAELLAEHKQSLDWAEADLNDADILNWDSTAAEGDDVLTLDTVAEQKYQALRAVWEGAVADMKVD